jgi:hypothetical protein
MFYSTLIYDNWSILKKMQFFNAMMALKHCLSGVIFVHDENNSWQWEGNATFRQFLFFTADSVQKHPHVRTVGGLWQLGESLQLAERFNIKHETLPI